MHESFTIQNPAQKAFPYLVALRVFLGRSDLLHAFDAGLSPDHPKMIVIGIRYIIY